MRIIAISDTHTYHDEVVLPEYEEGDILVHAGDITSRGEVTTVCEFGEWADKLPYEHILVIPGNHDFCFERTETCKSLTEFLTNHGVTLLLDSEVTIDGIKFYGSPWQPEFYDWAFNVPRGKLYKKWNNIPDDTDVLITHGPAYGKLGGIVYGNHHPIGDPDVGCKELFARMKELKNLKYHICGHIHEGYGTYKHKALNCTVINASSVDRQYRCVNAPFTIPMHK